MQILRFVGIRSLRVLHRVVAVICEQVMVELRVFFRQITDVTT